MASIDRLYTRSEVRQKHRLVMLPMTTQGFDGRLFTSTMVFGQRDEHPSHTGCFFPCTIKNILPCMNLLLQPWEGPIDFAVTHSGFIGTIQVIVVRNP